MPHPEYLGKYTIKTLLGQGAMGVVYKAFDPGIGRLVAIKTIRHALAHDPAAQATLLERFRNEARAVGRLSHPNIVAIYDLGQDAHQSFIVMEYVEGRDLAKILETTPNLPVPESMRLMWSLLEALTAAHGQGVWHRDIKPANLIVSESGQLKVTDFGIARIESAALTQVAMTIGTPGFMAPEQYLGEKIDHRVDLFAAGVLLYRLLTGQMPFAGTPEALMYATVHTPQPPLARFLAPELAGQFEPIVQRALAKSPEQRFASAAEFAQALRSSSPVEGSSLPVEGSSHPIDTSSQTTLVMPLQVSLPSPERTPAPGTQSGKGGETDPITHWNDASLVNVQAMLARFVGPMAKVQVRQAARRCRTLPELVDALALDIADPAQRASFVAQMQAQYATTLLAMAPVSREPTGTPEPSVSGVVQAIAPHVLDQATQSLTRTLGPIAKIVVKKTAAKARSIDEFVQLLAQEVPAGAPRAQWLASMAQAINSAKSNTSGLP